ncbi:MAG TPA: hypothetical protein VH113_01925 [Gemmatimonadales bacterium]|jgi:hypothetical protein|nr:hypothetical protein [Gemmatimonadales bacterium]
MYALLLSLAACHSSTGPLNVIHRKDLLALARSDSADPLDRSLVFKNNATVSITWTNNDSPVYSTFAVYHFSSHSIVSRNDTILADTSTVTLSASVTQGVFGFTLQPATVVFNIAGSPTIDVSYANFADFSVIDSAPSKYPDPTAFAQALKLYYEYAPDEWRALSTGNAANVASSALSQPGTYLLAAPK